MKFIILAKLAKKLVRVNFPIGNGFLVSVDIPYCFSFCFGQDFKNLWIAQFAKYNSAKVCIISLCNI